MPLINNKAVSSVNMYCSYILITHTLLPFYFPFSYSASVQIKNTVTHAGNVFVPCDDLWLQKPK